MNNLNIKKFPDGFNILPNNSDGEYLIISRKGDKKPFKISVENLSALLGVAAGEIQRIQAVDAGPLPTPYAPNRYMVVTGVGAYTFGGSTIGTNAEGYQTTFWWDGDAWSNNGSVRVKGDKGADGESVVELGDFSFSEVQQPIPFTAEANSLYYGFGQPYGIHNNIGGARFWYRIRETNIPTQMRFMIFDTNRDGIVLVDKTISIAPVVGTSGNTAVFEFDEVFKNTDNKRLWTEIRANGTFGWNGASPDVVYTEALGYPRRRVNITGGSDINTQPPSFGNNEAQIELLIYKQKVQYTEEGQEAFNNALSTTLSERFSISNEMFAKVTSTELRVMSKYNYDYDLLMIFSKSMFNQLFTFSTVGLVSNTLPELAINKISDQVDVILNTSGSDNIGPVNIQGYAYLGGNHSYDNDNVTKTAKNNYYKIFNGDKEITDGFEGYVNNLDVIVDVSIFDPSSFPTEVEMINERVLYHITRGNIEVSVSHKYNSAETLGLYYGAQINPSSLYTKIWFNNSFSDVQNYTTTGINSGAGNFNPNKVVISDDSKEFCMALQLNRNVGIGANPSQIGSSRNVLFTADITRKVYFYQLAGKPMSAGEEYFWNGCYSFFDGRNSEDDNIPYINNLTLEKKKMISLDSLSSGDYLLDKVDYAGRENESFHSVNATIPQYSTSRGVKVTFSDKGSIIIK